LYRQPERIKTDSRFKPIGQSKGGANAAPVVSSHVPISSDNVGAKILKAMGWQEGSGLGRDGSGITAPILAERRALGAGLGATGSTTAATGDYSDRVRNITKARYQEDLSE
jgi:RNA-binding protein 5/10